MDDYLQRGPLSININGIQYIVLKNFINISKTNKYLPLKFRTELVFFETISKSSCVKKKRSAIFNSFFDESLISELIVEGGEH